MLPWASAIVIVGAIGFGNTVATRIDEALESPAAFVSVTLKVIVAVVPLAPATPGVK